MLAFSSLSVAPSVAAWIGSLAAPFNLFFSATTGRPEREQAVVNAVAARAPDDTLRSGALGLDDPSLKEAGPCTFPEHRASSGPAYWPCERLNAFILQMAAHGHCVSASMMLGHRPYAVQQLAAAQQMPDEALRSLAAELQAYFEAPPDTAARQLSVL